MLRLHRVWFESLAGAFPPTRLQAPPPIYHPGCIVSPA